MLSITDTHLHLWDLSRFQLPWLSEVPELNHDVSWEDYQALVMHQRWRIDRALYVEVDVTPEQRGEEVRFLRELCEDPSNAVCGGIVSLDLHLSGAVSRWLDAGNIHLGVKGVRHVLHVPTQPPGSCLTSNFIDNVRQLGQAGLCFEVCLRTEELGDAVKLADRTPQTTLVLNHMGNVNAVRLAEDEIYARNWQQHLHQLAEHQQVWCKVSGVNIPSVDDIESVRPAVERSLEIFNSGKVVFATNYPVCNLATGVIPWVDILMDITHPQGTTYQTDFFSANAQRLYRLP